jgi:hypothetical protein
MRRGRTYPHLSQSRAKPPDRSGQPFLQSPPAGGGAAQAGFMHLLAPAAAIAMGPPGPSLSPVHRSGLAHHSHPGTQRERRGGGEGRGGRGQKQQQQQRERCDARGRRRRQGGWGMRSFPGGCGGGNERTHADADADADAGRAGDWWCACGCGEDKGMGWNSRKGGGRMGDQGGWGTTTN